MSRSIHQNRNGCALQGAVKTLAAVEGAVPVIHSNSGCAIRQTLHWEELPSTNLIEKQIVFGGASRLREQIKNTAKIMNGDLYVVVTGCSSEMVGDDVPAMVKEAQEQQLPVIGLETAGFRGSVYKGYELLVKGLLEKLPREVGEAPLPRGTVNLLGIVPGQDLFWEGTLERIGRLLDDLGLQANPLFGSGRGIAAWQLASRARLNLVLSPWGMEAARYLEEQYGIPALVTWGIPVGAEDENRLAAQVAERLGLDAGPLLQRNQLAIQRQARFLGKLGPLFYASDLQKEAAVVGPSAFAVGYARFLAECFGQRILAVIVTDDLTETQQQSLTEAFIKAAAAADADDGSNGGSHMPKLYFTEDTLEIHRILEEVRPEIILGSVLEKPVADKLEVPLLIAAGPAEDFVALTKSYAGTDGAMVLAEDYCNALLGHQKTYAPEAWRLSV